MSIKSLATASLTTLLVAVSAFAELPLKATIPFDFTAYETRMQAGEYDVIFDRPGLVRLAREDRGATAIILTMAVQAKTTPTTGKLVFNKYGDSYFLSEIWSPGYDRGQLLPKSQRELEIAKNGSADRPSIVTAASSRTRRAGARRP